MYCVEKAIFIIKEKTTASDIYLVGFIIKKEKELQSIHLPRRLGENKLFRVGHGFKSSFIKASGVDYVSCS